MSRSKIEEREEIPTKREILMLFFSSEGRGVRRNVEEDEGMLEAVGEVWRGYGSFERRGRGKIKLEKIKKCHTGTGIPKPYHGHWRAGFGSRNFIPGGYGSGSGSKFHYKGKEDDFVDSPYKAKVVEDLYSKNPAVDFVFVVLDLSKKNWSGFSIPDSDIESTLCTSAIFSIPLWHPQNVAKTKRTIRTREK
ncbi:hypothetical protein M9H77_11688 [Catharanthus roseus]|uniref:Uncharacterized protein n=1 Tax=Catharanthus roseus TaxID=4058 RepID=A0ACC0BFA2_CATRO|nr:hypothetical protein M9H77_11688 [Catharanthus roseus]